MVEKFKTHEFLKANLEFKKNMREIIKSIRKNKITNLQLLIATITIIFDSFGIQLTIKSSMEIDEIIKFIQEKTEKLVSKNELKFN